jgi:hypothetical protein
MPILALAAACPGVMAGAAKAAAPTSAPASQACLAPEGGPSSSAELPLRGDVSAEQEPVGPREPDAVGPGETPRVAPAAIELPKPTQTPEKGAAASVANGSVKLGLVYYSGLTNYSGQDRRSTDGVWAGAQTCYPSNVSLNWSRGESAAARLSIGIGDTYAGPHRAMEQPIEAWYQARVGGCQLTAGKYYTPFALQEWQWEPKYGMMLAGAAGQYSYSASFQYNTRLDHPNLYLHAGRQLGAKTTVGVSGAVGRGLSYDSSHDVALAADLTHEFAAARWVSEYVFADGPNGPFHFVFGKLTWTELGRWAPYLGLYYWHDAAGELGNFKSAVGGAAYRVTPLLSLEPNFARTGDRSVYWIQAHLEY